MDISRLELNIPISNEHATNPNIEIFQGRIDYSLILRIDGSTWSDGAITARYFLSVFPYQGKIAVVGSSCTESCIPILVYLEPGLMANSYSKIFESLAKTEHVFMASLIIIDFMARQDVQKYSPIILNLLRNRDIQENIKEHYSYQFAQTIIGAQARLVLEPHVYNLERLLELYQAESITYTELTSMVFDRLGSNSQRVGKFKVIRHKTAPQYH